MARRPHLTLCMLAAARALTTPPASRLKTPERAALGGVGAGWIALGARTFDAANARDGGRARRRDGHVRGQHPRAGRRVPGADVAALRAAGRVITRPCGERLCVEGRGPRQLVHCPRFRNDAPSIGLAVVAGAPVERASNSSPIPCLSRRRWHSRPRVPLKKTHFELIRGDIVELATDGGTTEEDGYARTLATFYRGSCLVGIFVGASFIFSPINPIGIFDTESPATHFFRALCGISIALVLAPAQSILWRAAKAGELSDNSSRALNAALGLASGLLVVDGRLQVEEGTRQFAANWIRRRRLRRR